MKSKRERRNNVEARLERDRGNRDAAIAAANKAYRQAWCDGPPFAYHRALNEATDILTELGTRPPAIQRNELAGAERPSTK